MFEPLHLPFRYGIVEEGIYRGAYPKVRNFRFLKRLRLKTILSLIPEQPETELVKFCKEQSINILWIRVNKPKENVPLSFSKILRCLQVMVTPENAPLYIHCLDGVVITGMVIACLRKLQMWSESASFSEYLRFSDANILSSEEQAFYRGFTSPIELTAPIPEWLFPSGVLLQREPDGVIIHPSLPCKILSSDSNLEKSLNNLSLNNEQQQLTSTKEGESFHNNDKDNTKIQLNESSRKVLEMDIERSALEVNKSMIVQALALEGYDHKN